MLELFSILLRALTNGQYGFHRDELATLDDARYLAWGYVAHLPVTPFIGRLALVLFWPSLIAQRFFAPLAQGISMLLAGLMARELGGKRLAQLITAIRRLANPWRTRSVPAKSAGIRLTFPTRGKSGAKWSARRVAGTRHPSGAAKFRFGNNDTPRHGNERSYHRLRLAIIADRVQEVRP